MPSVLRHSSEYHIFYLNTDIAKYDAVDWIKFTEVPKKYSLKGRFAPRRYKYFPLFHESLKELDVIFLDADTIVFEDALSDLFDVLKIKSFMIHGGYRPDDFCWYKQIRGLENFNLKLAAHQAGFNIRNISLNSGIVGRACDKYGLAFSDLLEDLLDRLPLIGFDEHAYSRCAYFNDEPYFALAYSELCNNFPEKGYLISGKNTYMTTTDAPNATPTSVFLDANQRATVHKNNEKSTPSIIHFVGYSRFDIYTEMKLFLLAEANKNKATD